MKKLIIFCFLLAIVPLALAGRCDFKDSYLGFSKEQILKQKTIPVYTFKTIKTYPHNPANFTEGFLIHDGILYEGTGLYGRSRITKIDLKSGKILKRIELSEKYFGEGITVLGNRLYQLSLKANTGFVYDKDTLQLEKKFHYAAQGWGLTTDGKLLIMSDGSSALHFIDPKTFQEKKHIFVSDGKKNIGYLNELEYVNGKIYANIWQSNFIAVISAQTGKIEAWIDLTGVNPIPEHAKYPYILNGIAYNPKNKSFFVTGKCWRKIYEIKVVHGQR